MVLRFSLAILLGTLLVELSTTFAFIADRISFLSVFVVLSVALGRVGLVRCRATDLSTLVRESECC